MPDSNEFSNVLQRWSEVFMRQAMHEFNRYTKEAGLSMPQLGVLMRLYHQGSCAVSDLSDHLGVTNAASSQLVERLVMQGYLDRTEDRDDRRVKRLSLTPEGKGLIERLFDKRQTWMERLTNALSPEDQHAIINALSQLTNAAIRLEGAVTNSAANFAHEESNIVPNT